MSTTSVSHVRRALAAALAAAGLLGVLTACSSSGVDDQPTSKPTASSSPSAKADDQVFSTPPADIEQVDAACTDGKVVVDQSNKAVTVGDCASVEITAGNAVVHLGDVDTLTVSGSINDIDAKQVGSVAMTGGGGNRLTTDGTPKITDAGDENVFVTR